MPDPAALTADPAAAAAPKGPTDRLLMADAEAMADLSKVEQEYKAKGQEIKGYYKDAADEQNRILGMQDQSVTALEGKQAEQQRRFAQLPNAPEAPDEPDVPSRQLRPFGDLGQNPSTAQLLQGTLTQLGLLATMGMGMAKGYPQGALAAYSGALDGWAKGDAIRAENMWKEYIASVAKMSREYQRQRQEYQDIIERFGISQDMLKTEATLFGIREGWQDKMISLAGRKPEEALKMFQVIEGPMAQVRQGVFKLKGEMIKAQLADERQRQQDQHWQQQMQETIRHNLQTEQLHRDAATDRQNKAGEKNQRHDSQVAVMEKAIESMKTLAPKLQAKGYLPSAPGPVAATRAWLNRQRGMGDELLSEWNQHQGTVVGFDRTIMNDLGRAQSAYAAAQEFIKHPPTLEGVNSVIRLFEDLIHAEKSGRGGGAVPPKGASLTWDPAKGDWVD